MKLTLKGNAAIKYPEKQTINLAIKENSFQFSTRVLLLGILGGLMIALFVYFGVVSPLWDASSLWREVREQEEIYDAMVEANKDSAELMAQADEMALKFSAGTLLVDTMSQMELMERYLMSKAGVHGVTITKGISSGEAVSAMSVVITGIDLEGVSAIVREMEQDILVDRVMVHEADSGTSGDGYAYTISMTIYFITQIEAENMTPVFDWLFDRLGVSDNWEEEFYDAIVEIFSSYQEGGQ